MFNMSFKLEDLKKLPTNEKGYIRVSMSELKSPDKFGNTHTCFENDYKKKKAQCQIVHQAHFKTKHYVL